MHRFKKSQCCVYPAPSVQLPGNTPLTAGVDFLADRCPCVNFSASPGVTAGMVWASDVACTNTRTGLDAFLPPPPPPAFLPPAATSTSSIMVTRATNAQRLMSVRLSLHCPGGSVTLSSSAASAGRAQQMLRQLGCATTTSADAQWSRTICSSAGHCTGDNQGSGLRKVLSKIWCPRKYSTSFGTFDLLLCILCTCTSYLCFIRMHEPVLVSMRRPRSSVQNLHLVG